MLLYGCECVCVYPVKLDPQRLLEDKGAGMHETWNLARLRFVWLI